MMRWYQKNIRDIEIKYQDFVQNWKNITVAFKYNYSARVKWQIVRFSGDNNSDVHKDQVYYYSEIT